MDRSAIMLLQVVVKYYSFNLLHPSTPSVVNELSTVLESLVYFAISIMTRCASVTTPTPLGVNKDSALLFNCTEGHSVLKARTA